METDNGKLSTDVNSSFLNQFAKRCKAQNTDHLKNGQKKLLSDLVTSSPIIISHATFCFVGVGTELKRTPVPAILKIVVLKVGFKSETPIICKVYILGFQATHCGNCREK